MIVEDNVGLSQMQKDWLLQAGYEVTTAIDEPAARRLLRRTAFDLILSDVRLPEGDGISLLEWTRKERMTTPYIIMTEYATVSDAVRAIRSGAKDYLQARTQRAAAGNGRRDTAPAFDRAAGGKGAVPTPQRTSPPRGAARHAGRAVGHVGLDSRSERDGQGVRRPEHPQVERTAEHAVRGRNCGVLPKELAPSLFFGHVKGAFTGADTSREGYFGMAEGGTLFLDEIGTMPYEIQAMLLRVLQENTYLPSAANGSGKRTCGSSRPRNEDMAKRFGTVVSARTYTTD